MATYTFTFIELRSDGESTTVTVDAPNQHEATGLAVQKAYGPRTFFQRDQFRPGWYGQIFRSIAPNEATSVTGRIRMDATNDTTGETVY